MWSLQTFVDIPEKRQIRTQSRIPQISTKTNLEPFNTGKTTILAGQNPGHGLEQIQRCIGVKAINVISISS
jgi:hypothetical protein